MATTAENLRDQVVSAFEAAPDPRAREVLTALARHLHDFVIETDLQVEEWLTAIEFLTAVGKMCDDRRQEFILLSDVAGCRYLDTDVVFGVRSSLITPLEEGEDGTDTARFDVRLVPSH